MNSVDPVMFFLMSCFFIVIVGGFLSMAVVMYLSLKVSNKKLNDFLFEYQEQQGVLEKLKEINDNGVINNGELMQIKKKLKQRKILENYK